MGIEYFYVNSIFIVILAAIYSKEIKHIKKQKTHIYIYTFVWALLVWGNQIIGPPYTINIITLITVYGAWVGFLIGAIIIYRNYSSISLKTDKEFIYSPIRLRIALFTLIGLSLLSNFLFFNSTFAKLQNLESLANLRSSEAAEVFSESNMFHNIFGRTYNIYVPMAFILFYYKKISPFTLGIILIIALVTSASMFTRAPILSLFVCIVVCVILIGKKIKFNLALITITVSFFGFIYYLSNEINTKINLTKTDNADELLVRTFYVYVFGGIKGYESIIDGTYVDTDKQLYDSGIYSLDFLNYAFKKIGLINNYPNLIRKYLPNSEIETNVYTYLDCFTLDLGIPGAILGSFLLGMITSYFAMRVHLKKTIINISLYCYCCSSMADIFMNNEFIRNAAFLMMIPLTLVEYIARTKLNKNRLTNSL